MLFPNSLKLIMCCLLLMCLPACASPREKSQALAEEIVEQLPTPEEAKLLYVEKVERLAKQGVGTSFGVIALYGSSKEYSEVVIQYQELLSEQGWEVYVRTPLESPWYCHPDYEAVVLSLGEHIAAFKDDEAVNIISSAKTTYKTLYVIGVTQFPFDETTECKAVD